MNATSLVDLLVVNDSGTWGDSASPENGQPVLRSTNIQDGRLSLDKPAYVAVPRGDLVRKKLEDGDIIVTKSSGSPGHIGKCCIFRQPADGTAYYFSNFTLRLRVDRSRADERFVFHWLNSEIGKRELAKLNDTTSGLRNLNVGRYLNQKVPAPPLEEQRRVADILDRTDAVNRKRQRALQLADDFLRATFLDMFGDSEAYRESTLEALSVDDGLKCGPFGTQLQRSEFQHEGVPLWGIKHLNTRFKLPTDEFVSSAKAASLSSYSLEAGDLVMTRKGDVGRCAVYPNHLPPGIMHSDLLRMRVDVAQCDPWYLLFLFHHSPDFNRQLASVSQGAVMAGVNVTKLKQLKVMVAPFERQTSFRRLVEQVHCLTDRIQKGQRFQLSLNSSLHHQLLTEAAWS